MALQFSNNVGNYLPAPNASPAGSFLARYNALNPQLNYTTDAFNAARAGGRDDLANLMLTQGGQQFRNAVAQADGMSASDLNSFINYSDPGTQYRGMSPDNVAALQGFGATAAPQTYGAPTGSTTIGQLASYAGNYVPPGSPGPLAEGGPVPGSTMPGAIPPGGAPSSGGGNVPPAGAGGALGGGLGAGLAPIPGTQPNYPLDIGSYLNPMMQYALGQGISTINNSAAAAGSLNSGNTLKELMQFGAGMGAQNFNNAANIAGQQQAFGYGVDNNDRNFAYQAQQADRNYDLSRLLGMGQLGLGGATQQGADARTQAQFLASLGLGLGNAQSAGILGQGNAASSAISQIIANLLGGNAVRQVQPT